MSLLKIITAIATGALVSVGLAPAEELLLTGATVHTVSGETLSPGQVLVRDGKIAAVGPSVSAANAKTLDLSGQHLYPGLIALDTDLGLTEIEAIRATADSTEVGEYTPDVQSWIAVSPDSELIPVTRANGIAYFEPVPAGGLVAGQSGLVAVEGWTSEERPIKKPMGLHVYWPAMELSLTPARGPRGRGKAKSPDEQAKERRTKLQSLADFFEEARAYAKAKDASANGGAPAVERIPAWEAMLPYVRGELPIIVHADDARQITSALNWATTNNYKLVLADARDAYKVAETIAAKHVPVIYSHTMTLPLRDSDGYDVHFSAPGRLQRAGVQVTFSLGASSFNAPMTRNLPYEAAQAIAFGLPAAEALKGITLYPAQIAGMADRLGSIEAGKEATLFSADGDIFDIRANVKHLWLAGKEISLDSRHTRLYEKYRSRPRAP